MQNQLLIFCICVAAGFVGGIVYECFHAIRVLFACQGKKRAWIAVILDIAFFLTLSVGYIFTAYAFHFPAFRVYMWIGYAVGLIIYLKTLHKILAFLQIMCYNRLTKVVKRTKKLLFKRRKKQYDAR